LFERSGPKRFCPYITLLFAVCGCGVARDEASIRKALLAGSVRLPAGVIEIHSELALPDGAHDVEISGAGSILRAANDFRGRAIFSSKSGTRIRFRDFRIDGNRDAIEQRTGLPDFSTPFHRFTVNNGILIEDAAEVAISGVSFKQIAGFGILVSHSKHVRIERARIEDSGSRNAAGRNNTTGGVLLEEGTDGFQVLDCELKNIRGNGLWTHSLYTSPRNANGWIARNRFDSIGRDAIQVGHATQIRVERNTGERIGYPEADVDVENKAIPVAIDTAGNTDRSVYSGNRFTGINGKCIDLDGFHHGEVTGNVCVNQRNFGIVMNNTNPDMQSEGITIADNTIDGGWYGGIFVIGTGNKVLRNKLQDLNTSHSVTPDLLRTGIYLGPGAERPSPARGNWIEDNVISGFKIKCIAADPRVSLAGNKVERNQCADLR
jgi:Right handed beta helix region